MKYFLQTSLASRHVAANNTEAVPESREELLKSALEILIPLIEGTVFVGQDEEGFFYTMMESFWKHFNEATFDELQERMVREFESLAGMNLSSDEVYAALAKPLQEQMLAWVYSGRIRLGRFHHNAEYNKSFQQQATAYHRPQPVVGSSVRFLEETLYYFDD